MPELAESTDRITLISVCGRLTEFVQAIALRVEYVGHCETRWISRR